MSSNELNKSFKNMNKKVILLDIDDTVCDSVNAYKKAQHDCYLYFRSIPFGEISEKKFNKFYKEARQQIHEELGNVASSHNRLLYFQRIFEISGIEFDAGQINKLAEIYWNSTNNNLCLFPGVEKTLKYFRKNGIKICLVSDLVAYAQFSKIKHLKLDKLVDCMLTSEEAGIEKPSEIIFKKALRKCGCTSGEAIMVGNSCARDIAGAKKMKIETVHFGNEKCTIADHHISRFDELIKIIEAEPFDSEDFAQDLREEGYIKFNYKWIDKASLSGKDVKELNSYRQKLYKLKLIGKINDLVGYGNISQRQNGKQFIITGSKTGLIKKLDAKHYSLVKNCDFKKNSLTCAGKVIASSESLSHAIIYQLSPKTNAVIHVHNTKLWEKLLNKVPTTNKKATYGTIEMTNEIKRLFKRTKVKDEKIIAMAGHPDGVIVFGENLAEAYQVLMRIVVRKINRS